jgi:enoyl-CoA hydratase
MKNEFIIVTPDYEDSIALIQLNRPKELNALNLQLMQEIKHALIDLDSNEDVKAIIITGNERAFAAGADIKQMSGKGAIDMLKIDQFSTWDQIRKTKKPIIAAVSGFALGGGCELCMICDMIVASESARFGQPEINIGVMPGAGGTQRLTRAVGKVKAMEMVLTGEFISAHEAKDYGLVNKVVPVEIYLSEAVNLAKKITNKSPLAVQMAKESVLKAFDMPLQEALYFERKNFYMLFATKDQKEGMSAFVEKRKANFKGE